MRDRTRGTIPAEIEATRTKFENWRRRRTSQERIPETLWSEAVELARRYGTWPAARSLRLDYNKLKQLAVAGKEGRALNRRFLHRHKDRIAGSISGFDRM